MLIILTASFFRANTLQSLSLSNPAWCKPITRPSLSSKTGAPDAPGSVSQLWKKNCGRSASATEAQFLLRFFARDRAWCTTNRLLVASFPTAISTGIGKLLRGAPAASGSIFTSAKSRAGSAVMSSPHPNWEDDVPPSHLKSNKQLLNTSEFQYNVLLSHLAPPQCQFVNIVWSSTRTLVHVQLSRSPLGDVPLVRRKATGSASLLITSPDLYASCQSGSGFLVENRCTLLLSAGYAIAPTRVTSSVGFNPKTSILRRFPRTRSVQNPLVAATLLGRRIRSIGVALHHHGQISPMSPPLGCCP